MPRNGRGGAIEVKDLRQTLRDRVVHFAQPRECKLNEQSARAQTRRPDMYHIWLLTEEALGIIVEELRERSTISQRMKSRAPEA